MTVDLGLFDEWPIVVALFVGVYVCAALASKRLRSSRLLKHLIVTVAVAMVISFAMKTVWTVPRPCAGMPACPPSSGLPSGHTAFAFSFALPFLGTVLYPVMVVLAWVVGWSRVALGLHSWLDVAAGIGVAGISYHLSKLFVNPEDERPVTEPMGKEILRQCIHILAGFVIAGLLYWFGLEQGAMWLTVFFALGTLAMQARASGLRIPLTEWIFDTFERKNRFGHGAMYYASGAFLALGMLRSFQPVFVILWILSVGDGLSTLAGKRFGRHKLPFPFNRSKSVEGSAAFLVGSLLAYPIYPVYSTLAAVCLATVVEALDLKVDDNVLIPVVCALVYML